MTTQVIVKAHCDPDTTEVRIDVNDEPAHKTLQDGEEAEINVYDSKKVTVREVLKEGVTPVQTLSKDKPAEDGKNATTIKAKVSESTPPVAKAKTDE